MYTESFVLPEVIKGHTPLNEMNLIAMRSRAGSRRYGGEISELH